MGKKPTSSSNKNKEKRQARKHEQRRIADGMSFVTLANQTLDAANLCKDLLTFKTKDLDVKIYICRIANMEKEVIEWAIDLTEKNMKQLYESCAWGWHRSRKEAEMRDDTAWYAVATDTANQPLAFSHFRFDMDYGEPVLYCYELQVEGSGWRRGIGARLLAVLERLAGGASMRCVRLTALKHNPPAAAFFRACGYTLDETSPVAEEAAHYEILSKSVAEPAPVS